MIENRVWAERRGAYAHISGNTNLDGRRFPSNPCARRFRPTTTAGQQDGTTVNERLRSMTSAEAAKRLGPLIRNQMTTMGLDNFPKRCDCPKHSHLPNQSDDGTTHHPGEPCPFEKDDFPKGMLGTCCSLRGKVAAHELSALSLDCLALSMHTDMTAEQAAAFAGELRSAADQLERKYAGKADKPKGAGWNGTWNAKTREVEYHDHSTFEEALAAIREAARWYAKVASLGYGVHAWY